MKKFLSFAICGLLGLQVHAQYLNGGFDQAWVKDTKGNGALPGTYLRPGTQPVDWEASNVNQKVLLSKTEILVTPDTDRKGSATGKSAKMVNKYVGVTGIGSNAPAYITLGTPWVFAVSNISNCDGGTLGGIPFSHKPDAIKGFFKRTGSANDPAKIIVYAWKGTYTSTVKTNPNGGISSTSTTTVTDQDRCIWNDAGYNSKTEGAKLIAKCDYGITETLSDWTEIEVPLTYESNEAPEKINVVLSASNYWNRGAIEKEGTLWADDVQFVYYSQLESLAYNGLPLAGFNKDTYTYTLDVVYDAAKIAAFANGKGASVITRYNELTGLCTVRVEGQDISLNPLNFHEYKIQFNSALDKNFENTLSVSIDGVGSEPLLSTINLKKESDGEYSLALNNFYFAGVLGIGNIYMKGLTVTEEGAITRFATNQVIQIAPGDDPNVDWMGPLLGNVPVVLEATHKDGKLVAEIDIDMTSTLEQVIHVSFAPELIINDTEAFTSAATGLYNVTLNRSFKSGWNTICLPFATTPEAIAAGNNGVYVQGFTSYDANGLNFSVVEEMQANTPYMVYYLMDCDGPIYLSGNVVAGEPIEVTHGDFTLKGTYEPMSMSGLYGVAKVGDVNKLIQGGANATINGTRAYFQSNTPNVKNVKVNFEGETVDAIGGVEADGATTYDVYTLSGVQVRKGAVSLNGLSKGVYIVNGKKMIIK